MKSIYKKYVRIYYVGHIIVFFVFVILSTVLATIFDNTTIVPPLVGVYIIFLVLFGRFIEKKLLDLFYTDLNAHEYRGALKKLGIRLAGSQIVSAIYDGDYQTAVNIVTSELNNRKTPIKTKYVHFFNLATVYFHLRDLDKLKTVIEKHDEFLKKYPTLDLEPRWEYYKAIISHDYDTCLAVCEKRKAGINYNSKDSKIISLTTDFYTAVALYDKGERLPAKEIFERIAADCPNFYLAQNSARYIDTIESGEAPIISKEEILPQADALAKFKRSRTWALIRFVIISCLFVCTMIFHFTNPKDPWTVEYEKQLDIAISETYDEAECIDYFWLEKDGEELDSLCLVETNGKLALLSVTTPDGGKTADTWVLKEGIDPSVDTSQYAMCVTSKYYIRMNFSTEKPKCEPLYYSVKFKFSGTTYWFYIDYYENVLLFD